MSDKNLEEYGSLIKRAEPDFVHIKGYKAVGYARERMGYDSQVWHEEVLEFAKRICENLTGYSVRAEEERSCVVCVAKDGVDLKIGKI
jgi:tRNA wybutosine-synthesizing protein 1